jgi:hypothetical protein
MTATQPAISKNFRGAALGAAMLGAIGIGTSSIGITVASLSPAFGQAKVVPVAVPGSLGLKKMSLNDCKFMADRAIEMVSSFAPDHFSPKFKQSIGGFTTRSFDCSGTPVLVIDKPEDDRGVLMLWKTMGDNKRGNLLDSVVVFDPKGIAPLSKVLKPERVVKALPPELASAAQPSAGPRG